MEAKKTLDLLKILLTKTLNRIKEQSREHAQARSALFRSQVIEINEKQIRPQAQHWKQDGEFQAKKIPLNISGTLLFIFWELLDPLKDHVA
ncbi:MAG: hypothetical protein ACRC8Q_10790 [Aeromonas sp.]